MWLVTEYLSGNRSCLPHRFWKIPVSELNSFRGSEEASLDAGTIVTIGFELRLEFNQAVTQPGRADRRIDTQEPITLVLKHALYDVVFIIHTNRFATMSKMLTTNEPFDFCGARQPGTPLADNHVFATIASAAGIFQHLKSLVDQEVSRE